MRAFYDRLWNAWDDSSVEAVLHPDLAFRGSLGTVTHGLAEWRGYRDAVRRGSGDFHNEVVSLVVSGDDAAARMRWTGTHTGKILGVPATGRRFAYEGGAFFTAANGLIVRAWVVGDVDSLRDQLTAPDAR